jgi:plasmid segregation protein ParM
MDVLGIDIGFGFTKACNSKEHLMFKSIFGDAVDIQFQSDFGNGSHTNNLHVTIDDRAYFVGDYAEKQSNLRQYTLNQEKLLTDFVKVLSLTVAGKLGENGETLNVVSGLPVASFKEYHKRFAEILTGQHEITFHRHDGSMVSRQIFIRKILMMPQPLGSFFNLLMDDNGKITNANFAKQKIGVIDIGFRTTDITIFDNLQIIERASRTTDTGISKIFQAIANRIQKESGINVELYRLYDAVQSGNIKLRGQKYNIKEIRDTVFSQEAETIATDVERLWADDWDIDAVILSGGGSMEPCKYLPPLIPSHVIPMDQNTDARLNNVSGYLKYGKYVWEKSGPASPASADTEE